MPTLTINTTIEQQARIAAAFGKLLGSVDITDIENPIPIDATGAEVKEHLMEYMRIQVFKYERQVGADAVVIDPLEPT
jgi:hypothetical protein